MKISIIVLIVLLLSFSSFADDISNIKWVTNLDDPPLGSSEAVRGGTLHSYIGSYPLTFRLYGPNSNNAFAGWTRPLVGYVFEDKTIQLVMRHPTTDNFIPCLATHWSIQDDNKTIYYKLDPDARWNDGKPVTADDYVFANEFLRSKAFPMPFENKFMEDYIESVEKISDYVIKVVGVIPSWRPLNDYNFGPLPKHAIKADADFPERENYKSPVGVGPYVISGFKEGEFVEFTRLKKWWGEDKHYFQGMYNVDKIHLLVINDQDRAFDYLKKGDLDLYEITSAKMWSTQFDFEGIKKGYVHRKRVFLNIPQGLYGLMLNLRTPIFQNKDFRKALQYLFDFEQLNKKLMYNAYYRAVSVFEQTEYENKNLIPYGFNPKKAREHLIKSGFKKRGNDGILVDDKGNRASFTLTYGSKGIEPHLTVVKNTYQKAGVEIKLQLLEPGASFEKILEKAFEMQLIAMTAGFYPDPHQYFSSEFKDDTQNNNFWSYGNPEVDKLIDIYRFSMDKQERLDAAFKIDEIIQDDAIYIPFFMSPFIRFAYWDYVRFPEFYLHKRTEQMSDFCIYWIDQDRKKRLEEAIKMGKSLGEDREVDIDPYGVKASMDMESM